MVQKGHCLFVALSLLFLSAGFALGARASVPRGPKSPLGQQVEKSFFIFRNRPPRKGVLIDGGTKERMPFEKGD